MTRAILLIGGWVLFSSYAGFIMRIRALKVAALLGVAVFPLAILVWFFIKDEAIWIVALAVEGTIGALAVFTKEFKRVWKSAPSRRRKIAVALLFVPGIASLFVSQIHTS